ncbi:serine protease [[Phormidium] sp. ETS-05]|uniref:S1 family peptidase n=1 Tax=[Phormidium] sp. ETS-05 TaxID=222819 RepID=UPI0018EF054F|nr:serine protease [[Phormidium] sp. ETS-05]
MTNDQGQIAIRQFTVRLMGEQTAGSGVIVARHGQTYTVLTCAHVIAWDGGEELQVMTHDGSTHIATRNHNFDLGDLDLAVVQFTTNQDYPTAPIDANNPNLALQQPVYVSGFPNSTPNGSKLETGLASLMTSYLMSSGDLVLVLDRPLERGYQIGLSNDIYIGMSGGPVLNHQGYLIAIIGRTKYAFGGPSAYRFADGTDPEPELLSQMESASWAIPIFCHWSFVTCPLSFDK